MIRSNMMKAIVVRKYAMTESTDAISDRERAMLDAFRILPLEVRNTIERTIETQANRYAPKRGRLSSTPRLSLVVAASGR